MQIDISGDIKRWQREIRRGVLKMCVLLLLSKNEMYGYEISKVLEKLGNGVLKIKEGTLYPLLRRLENEGYVSAKWMFHEGKARRYYKITMKGLAFLNAVKPFWQKLVVAVESIMRW